MKKGRKKSRFKFVFSWQARVNARKKKKINEWVLNKIFFPTSRYKRKIEKVFFFFLCSLFMMKDCRAVAAGERQNERQDEMTCGKILSSSIVEAERKKWEKISFSLFQERMENCHEYEITLFSLLLLILLFNINSLSCDFSVASVNVFLYLFAKRKRRGRNCEELS